MLRIGVYPIAGISLPEVIMCNVCECGEPVVTWDDVPEWYKQMCIDSKPEDEWVMVDPGPDLLPTGERVEDMD